MQIAFEHVTFSYEQDAPCRALNDISFTISSGECLGIAGPTGSGKSTLIRHLNGLLHPQSGRVLVDGDDLADVQVARVVRKRVGMVFQYPEQQLFASTVYDDVAFGPRNFGLEKSQIDERVRRALADVHLPFEDFYGANPFKLSGGEQRRVALAGVLACQPDVLVLDEPTAGLDPAAREDLLKLLKTFHDDGKDMVVVSHITEDLVYLADHIMILEDGSVFTYGTPQEVLSDVGILEQVGLAAPLAQQFACRMRARGFDLSRTLYDEDTLVADLADNILK